MSGGDARERLGTMATETETGAVKRDRYELPRRLENWLEAPMLVLAFVWQVVLIVALVRGESPLFHVLGTMIWVVFILDFAVK